MDQRKLNEMLLAEIDDTLTELRTRLNPIYDALAYGATNEAHDGLYANSCEGLMLNVEDILTRISGTRRQLHDYGWSEEEVKRYPDDDGIVRRPGRPDED